MINDYNKNGVTKMETRFTYYPNSQMIKDTITGHTYEGNRKICRLLNDLNDGQNETLMKHIARLHEENFDKDNRLKEVLKVNENQQKLLMEFEELSEKYNIKLEDIPVTFEEYVALDNGDEL